MGLAEIRAIKKMDGLYAGESATAKVVAGLKPKEKKPIAKMSEKKKAQVKFDQGMFLLDKSFYAEVWSAAPHQCEVCKLNLGNEPLTIFFHHILPKSIYPAFRHTAENICILCPEHHTQVETDINKVPYVKKRTEKVTKELLG